MPAVGKGSSQVPTRRRRSWWLSVGAVGLLALVLRCWAPGPMTQRFDEELWLARSDGFRSAVAHRDLDRATASPDGQLATLPGVTTMWAGALGRDVARATGKVGLSDPVAGPSVRSAQVLRAGRALVALATSLALVATVLAGAALVGRRAALVAGVLMATEPFFVGHGATLHTDALVAQFGAAAVVLAAVAGARSLAAVGLVPARPPGEDPVAGRDGAGELDPDPDLDPEEGDEGERPASSRFGWIRRDIDGWAAAAGVAAALGALSKINAVVLVGVGAALLTLALAAEVARRDRRLVGRWARTWARVVAVATGSAVLTTLLLWPALWVDPVGQARAVRRSATQLDVGSPAFFDGGMVATPPARFVVVSMAWRVTPWFLVGAAVAAVVAVARRWWRRGSRPAWAPWWFTAVGVGTSVAYLAAVTRSDRQYDRYGLPTLPFVALAIGAAVAAGARLVETRAARAAPARRRLVPVVGWVAAGALALHTLALAPDAVAYVNPALGGQEGARSEITLGGAGIEQMGRAITEREGGRCEGVRTMFQAPLQVALPCGEIARLELYPVDLDGLDYVIIVVSMRQRGIADPLDTALAGRGELVATAELGGVTYAELWAVDGAGPEPDGG